MCMTWFERQQAFYVLYLPGTLGLYYLLESIFKPINLRLVCFDLQWDVTPTTAMRILSLQ